MTTNNFNWPAESITGVRLVERGGAWFVHFEGPDGVDLRLSKENGRAKGFRRLDPLVTRLRFAHDVKVLEVSSELRQRIARKQVKI